VSRPPIRARQPSRAGLRALLRAAACGVAPGQEERLARALRAARRAGVPERELLELGLMLRLYAGFPAAIEFLRALAPVRGGRTIAAGRASQAGARTLARRGEALCARVYGPEYTRLRAFMRRLHPDLDRWMIEEGYGKTLARKGLSATRRELATVAALSALGWAPQGEAHARGAVRVGAAPKDVALARGIGARCRSRARS